MVFEYIPQLVIVISLFVIIIIIARKVPKTAEVDESEIIKDKKKSEIKKIFVIIWESITKFYYKVFGKLKRKAKEVKDKARVVSEQDNEDELSRLAEDKIEVENIPQATADEVIDLLESASGFYGKGDFGKAEKIYIEIITKDKKNVRAYKGLGRIYKRQRNFIDAQSSFEQAVKINPEDQEAREQLGEVKNLIKK